MFVGAHERQLDDKGRVALPATYRSHLGEHCYLVKGTDKCVEVIPSEAFEQFGRELIAKVERGDLTLNRQRAIASSAVLVALDKQGRVNVDEKLRERILRLVFFVDSAKPVRRVTADHARHLLDLLAVCFRHRIGY